MYGINPRFRCPHRLLKRLSRTGRFTPFVAKADATVALRAWTTLMVMVVGAAAAPPTTEIAELLASDGAAGDWLGYAVAIDGDVAVIGAREDTDVLGWAGAAYVFRFDGSCWVEQAKLQASDAHIASEFGWSVAISGDTIVVGTPLQSGNIGSAYVFVEPAGGWDSVPSPIYETRRLWASDRAAGDGLGESVAIADNHVLAGAPRDDNPNGNGAGAVYYYQEPAGGWGPSVSALFQTQKLLATDTNGQYTDDSFGVSVAVSGSAFGGYRVAVGADGDDDRGINAGAAYGFYLGATWIQDGKLLATDGAPGDGFGGSVDILAPFSLIVLPGTAVIGARWDDSAAGPNAGSAYVFDFNPIFPGGGWFQTQKLLASDGAPDDRFGTSVAISSADHAVIGAVMDDNVNGLNAGSAYVFTRGGVGWFEDVKLLASDGAATDYFGHTVAITGSTAIVGAHDHGHTFPSAGAAYVFVPESTVGWFEDFDAYPLGSGMHGQGGWKGWDDNPVGDAVVSNAQAHGAPQSVDIAGPSDLVHEFCGYTSDDWTHTAWMYVPGDFQSGGAQDRGSYFVLLNTYNDGGPYNWSVQLRADSDTGTFIRDGVNPTSLPLITDRWVKVEVDISLSANLYRVYYGGTELGIAESWTAGVFGGGGGVLEIAAVDLFANGSTSVYWDDLSVRPLIPREACCLPDATCILTEYMTNECADLGGDPQGGGSDCSTTVCHAMKWAQPPTFNLNSAHPECLWGWDEPSIYAGSQIVADDWACMDGRAITDIHWWGSYLGWDGIDPPQPAPDRFHIGIWTDVPAGVGLPFSHPGTMIWGWVVDRTELNERPVACDWHPDHMDPVFGEGCFRYDFIIPEVDWFHQGPSCNIYWISIAAWYLTGAPPAELWGWKTRRPEWNDDAVKIFSPTAPGLGLPFVNGEPIESAEGSWDMSFVLTTERCPTADPPSPEPALVDKNRFISLVPNNASRLTALRVTLSNLPGDYDIWNGKTMWVTDPRDVTEQSGESGSTPLPTFKAAYLTCQPDCRDWSAIGLIDVYGEAVIPGAQYQVQAIDCDCDFADEANYSAGLPLTTSRHGDICGPFASSWWPAPDGVVNIPIDTIADMDKFENQPFSPRKSRTDLVGIPPHAACVDMKITVTDYSETISAFRGYPYRFSPTAPDPCNASPCPVP